MRRSASCEPLQRFILQLALRAVFDAAARMRVYRRNTIKYGHTGEVVTGNRNVMENTGSYNEVRLLQPSASQPASAEPASAWRRAAFEQRFRGRLRAARRILRRDRSPAMATT